MVVQADFLAAQVVFGSSGQLSGRPDLFYVWLIEFLTLQIELRPSGTPETLSVRSNDQRNLQVSLEPL